MNFLERYNYYRDAGYSVADALGMALAADPDKDNPVPVEDADHDCGC